LKICRHPYPQDGRKTTAAPNVVTALFTSRHVAPLTHLHTHCIILNATFDPPRNAGKLQNYELLRARICRNVYYHEFARELRSFGYQIQNAPAGIFAWKGCGRTVRAISKRHAQLMR